MHSYQQAVHHGRGDMCPCTRSTGEFVCQTVTHCGPSVTSHCSRPRLFQHLLNHIQPTLIANNT